MTLIFAQASATTLSQASFSASEMTALEVKNTKFVEYFRLSDASVLHVTLNGTFQLTSLGSDWLTAKEAVLTLKSESSQSGASFVQEDGQPGIDCSRIELNHYSPDPIWQECLICQRFYVFRKMKSFTQMELFQQAHSSALNLSQTQPSSQAQPPLAVGEAWFTHWMQVNASSHKLHSFWQAKIVNSYFKLTMACTSCEVLTHWASLHLVYRIYEAGA